MKLITHQELRNILDAGQPIKLVMTMHENYYRQAHIPGSLNIFRLEDALDLLQPDDDIVIYCVDEQCKASIVAYHLLDQHGYRRVRRFAGGLTAWTQAGYPVGSVQAE